MRKVKDLKDNNGEKFYPKSHAKAVYLSDGRTVEDAIAEALEKGRELAKRDLYIAAGALYNDTDEVIKRTAFWGKEVDHLPKHYYLNGLGDITEEEISYIYQLKDSMTTFIASASVNGSRFFQDITDVRLRTLFGTNNTGRWIADRVVVVGYPFHNTKIEVIKWTNTTTLSSWPIKSSDDLTPGTDHLRVIDKFVLTKESNFSGAVNLEELRLLDTNFNVGLLKNSKISKESIIYIIKNVLKSTTKTLTITLHPDVYAKCIEGGEWFEEVNTALETANAAITGGGSINLVSE